MDEKFGYFILSCVFVYLACLAWFTPDKLLKLDMFYNHPRRKPYLSVQIVVNRLLLTATAAVFIYSFFFGEPPFDPIEILNEMASQTP